LLILRKMMHWIAYVKPKWLNKVLSLLEEMNGKGRVIAGGTDIVPQLRRHEFKTEILVDITEIQELRQIYEEEGWIRIGAGVTYGEVARSPLILREAKALAQGCARVGSPQIRNMGTLVGNVVNGQPAADGAIPLRALDLKTSQGSPYGTSAFATQGVLVSIDLDTGEIEVLDIVACHDVGRAVNPINVVAEIEGGVSMGLGYGLMEEVLLREGTIQNSRFSEYFVPTALDVPEVTSLLVESEEPTGPFGAKGVGEPALLPTAPAIVNAIAVATGIHAREIPVSSEALWKLLKEEVE
jgi:CO/xanthine dehydrogenase Mo-binding subunit